MWDNEDKGAELVYKGSSHTVAMDHLPPTHYLGVGLEVDGQD